MAIPTFTCTLGTCPISLAYVHYRPTIAGNAFMIGAFSLLTPVALFLGIRYRTTLYTSVFVAGLVGEVVGYAGRILLNENPFSKPAFLTYLICLTLAPVFMTAAIYLTLARVVVLYGERLSFVRPRSYTYIFTGFDVVALAVQAAGGAIAALAEDAVDIQKGTHILVAGLSVQIASLLAFVVFTSHFAWQVRTKPELRSTQHAHLYQAKHFRLFLWNLGITTLLILIRSCYRTAELSGGFAGYLAQDEVVFMILDGALILSACILMTVMNPGWAFRDAWADTAYRWGRSKRAGGEHSGGDERAPSADHGHAGEVEENKAPMII